MLNRYKYNKLGAQFIKLVVVMGFLYLKHSLFIVY